MKACIVVCCFILFDIITGLIKAIYKEGLNSTALRKGLFSKLSEVMAIIGAWLLEYGITYIDLGIDLPILEALSVYICIMELISIIENLCILNPRLAKFFKPYLEKLKGKENQNK